jgi:serine phosphatase RsbU (regulator of sigma subunit)
MSRRSTSSRGLPVAVAQQARTLPPELAHRIEVDPLFQVMTLDHQHWIDPYTGRAVPASLGRVRAAHEYLLENDLWREHEPLPMSRLDYERWRHDLVKLIPLEPRLRLFDRDGAWLNPYTGEFVHGVTRDEGKLTAHTVAAMARNLCASPAARGGRLLEAQFLVNKARTRQDRPDTTSYFSRQPKAYDEAMEKAKSVQQNMLSSLPFVEGFQFAVHYTPHHGVSGDFYEVLTLPDDRVLLVVGDVSGHGMQAALVVATALKTLRFIARQTSDLVNLVTQFNAEIRADLLPGQFITLFAGALDPITGRFSCVRAGHHASLIANMRSDVVLRRIGRIGMAVGLASGQTFSATLREEVVQLEPGDVLVQYTDGVTEALSPSDDEYGEARLYASVLDHMTLPPQQLVDGIAHAVARHANGSVGDDLTILAVVVGGPRQDSDGSSEDPADEDADIHD